MAQESLPRKFPRPVPRISRRSARRWLEHHPEPGLLVDLSGQLFAASRGAEILFGRPRQQLRGRNLLEPQEGLLALASIPVARAALARLARYEVDRPRDVVLQRPDGTEVVVESCLLAIQVGDRRMLYALLRDVTDQRQDAARFEATLAQVSRLSMAGQMAAGMAHEINRSMSVICNFAAACDLLLHQKSADLAQLAEWHQKIVHAARHAAELVQRMRGFDGTAAFRREPCRLAELVEQSLLLVQSEWPVRPIEFVWEGGTSGELRVDVDRIQVVHVLVNLLRNAVDAIDSASSRGRIVVDARRVERFVEVGVADNGCGLSHGVADHVFEPFETNKAVGLGIGLTLAKLIIEAHGGRLWAEGQMEGGAVFRFTLPLAPTDAGNASSLPTKGLRDVTVTC
jgi:two-component system sensor kinase FixL